MLDAAGVAGDRRRVLATSYTGFLFAQGLGRDLWQGPHAGDRPDRAVGRGRAAACCFSRRCLNGGARRTAAPACSAWSLAASLLRTSLILLFEHVLSPSPTRHHELAVADDPQRRLRAAVLGRRHRRRRRAPAGRRRLATSIGVSARSAASWPAALLALAGGAAWEYIWVEAGQSVPLELIAERLNHEQTTCTRT